MYVTLYSLVGGQWLNNQYTYTAFNQAASQGVITSPTPGSTFTSNSVVFVWIARRGASAYWLDAAAHRAATSTSSRAIWGMSPR